MASADLLLPEVLAPLVRNTIFAGHIYHWLEADSTNSLAMFAAAEAGKSPETAPEGSVFLAEEQTKGRGRAGHRWHSEWGMGIYCSFAVRPKISPEDALWLSLVAGVAAHEAVREVTGVVADIRWPNDLLIGERKFCGILTEMSSGPTRVHHAAIGIGINVGHRSFPEELQNLATSLRLATGKNVSRVELTAALIKSLDREYRMLLRAAVSPEEAHGLRFAPILRRVEARSSYVRGKRVFVDEDEGYTGVTDGLDARGFLRVATSKGVRIVISGGVRPWAGEDHVAGG
ncbi:MAG TPA: biotin--[acetyl-CoA-carboxylase] ligase [Alphaproteobacteria bacterium]|nr:biotin--[acetyl-CoA-carboxylase] ligase [Alphaproteobacteria bacterium]